MKLIRPVGRETAPVRPVRPRKLNWKQERIEDRPQFVLLACGHRDNMAIRATIILNLFSGVEMYCSRCKAFTRIKKKIRLLEYHGIKRVKTPEHPPF